MTVRPQYGVSSLETKSARGSLLRKVYPGVTKLSLKAFRACVFDLGSRGRAGLMSPVDATPPEAIQGS